METENKEPEVMQVPIFLNEMDMQKMVYIMFNQDIPMIKDILQQILKKAGDDNGAI